MISLLTKHLRYFYLSLFALIFITVGATTIYFFKEGFFSKNTIHNNEKIYKTLNAIKTNKLTKYYNEGKTSELQSEIDITEKLFLEVEGIENSFKNNEAYIKFQELKKEIINESNGSKFKAFRASVQEFYTEVNRRSWKTLTRNAERILSIIDNSNKENSVSDIKNNISFMEEVTLTSALAESNKNFILSELAKFNNSLTQLEQEQQKRILSQEKLKSFQAELDHQITQIDKLIISKKLHQEKLNQIFFYSMVGVTALSFLALLFGGIFQRFFLVKAQARFEKSVEEIITNRFINESVEDKALYSEEFNDFTEQMLSYLNKRMSLGSLFQETLPFAAILVDQNMKISWANKYFSDVFSFDSEEINKGYVSWDYLSQKTNLGENNPVLEALKFQISGIFQIEIQKENVDKPLSYELYVAPATVNKANKVMLFFYPLDQLSVEIENEKESILTPSLKAFETLTAETIDKKELEKLKEEFVFTKQLSLYERFVTLYHKIEQTRERDQKINKELSMELEFYRTSSELLKDQVSKLETKITDTFSMLKNMRSHFLKMVGDYEVIKDAFLFARENGAHLSHEALSKIEDTQKLSKYGQSLEASSKGFEILKNDFKVAKRNFSTALSDVSISFVQVTKIASRLENAQDSEKFNSHFLKISQALKHLELDSSDFDKKVINLEILLTKTSMIMNELTSILPSEFDPLLVQNLVHLRRKFEEIKDIDSSSIYESEEHIIAEFGNLYQTLKKEPKTIHASKESDISNIGA